MFKMAYPDQLSRKHLLKLPKYFYFLIYLSQETEILLLQLGTWEYKEKFVYLTTSEKNLKKTPQAA